MRTDVRKISVFRCSNVFILLQAGLALAEKLQPLGLGPSDCSNTIAPAYN